MEYRNIQIPHQEIFFYTQWAQEPSHCRTTSCHLSSIPLEPMVIKIPSESEASDATVISGFLIDEEV